jgi:Tol biopolymer transport system component
MEGDKPFESRVNLIDVADGKKVVIAQKAGAELFAPAFSPDGKWIAFQSLPNDSSSTEQLFVIPVTAPLPVETSRWIPVTGPEQLDARAQWSPDGTLIYFISTRDGSNCLWAVKVDAAAKTPVGEAFPVRHFHTNPRQYSNSVFPMFSLAGDRIAISMEQVQSDVWMTKLPEDR